MFYQRLQETTKYEKIEAYNPIRAPAESTSPVGRVGRACGASVGLTVGAAVGGSTKGTSVTCGDIGAVLSTGGSIVSFFVGLGVGSGVGTGVAPTAGLKVGAGVGPGVGLGVGPGVAVKKGGQRISHSVI